MPTLAAAPGLTRDPGDHLERIVLLLGEILIVQDAVRIARAAHVDAHAGVAAGGEPGMHALVAPPHEVALAIWDVLEDGAGRAQRSAPAGIQRRAASRQPSDSGIQTVSRSRIIASAPAR